MNRSILIVICDFLVLSAMSLSMGMAKVTSQGPGVHESVRPVTHTFLLEQLEKAISMRKETAGENSRLNEALSEAQNILKQLKEDVEQKEKRLEKMETALSSAADSLGSRQAELDAARKKAEDLANALAKAETSLSGTSQNLSEKNAALAKATADLEVKAASLQKAQLTLAEQNALLQISKEELEKKKAELKASESSLSDKNAELAHMLREAERHERAIQENQKRIAEKEAALFRAELLALERKNELDKTKKLHITVQAELEKASKNLKMTQEERAYTEGRLAQANDEIDTLKKDAGTREMRLREAESTLQEKRGQLSLLQTKMAEEMQKQATLRLNLLEREDQLKQQKERIQDKERLLAVTAEQVKTAETKLKAKDQVIQQTTKTLSHTESELARATELLRNDALTAYSKAAAQVRFVLKNDRLFNSFDLNETFYLPRIVLGGKVFLPCAFEKITGLSDQKSGYTTVKELKYMFKAPGADKDPETVIEGPILSLSADPRACLIELPGDKNPALPVFTADALRKNGLKDLTLFKANRFGEESALLNGRCSMRPNQDKYFLVRNSLRSSSEIPASVGDLVIAKEGRLAGIVVRVVPYPEEGRADAWCFIFPQKVTLSDATAISISNQGGEQPYAAFVNGLNALRKIITELNRKPVEK